MSLDDFSKRLSDGTAVVPASVLEKVWNTGGFNRLKSWEVSTVRNKALIRPYLRDDDCYESLNKALFLRGGGMGAPLDSHDEGC